MPSFGARLDEVWAVFDVVVVGDDIFFISYEMSGGSSYSRRTMDV